MNHRICSMLMLAVFSAPALTAESFSPGARLDGLISNPSSQHRYSIIGGPAGAYGDIPTAPNAAGKHWLVTYGNDQRVLAWTRFEVATDATDGNSAAGRAVHLLIDAEPPTATLTLAGASVAATRAGESNSDAVSSVLGPQASISIEATDPSGGVTSELLVDGKPLPAGKRFQTDRLDGRYQLTVRTRDALGNAGERAQTTVQFDSTPATLTWQRLDAGDEVPVDVFDGKRARLSISASDAGAGVQSLQIGTQPYDQDDLAEGALEIKVSADSLEYQLTDRVGNVGRGRIALRADSDGPQMIATRNGEPVDLKTTFIRHSDTLRLTAEDALSGVARACVEVSNGIHSCRSLPFELTGMKPGSYSLEFRAVDRLGNGTVQLQGMEVLP